MKIFAILLLLHHALFIFSEVFNGKSLLFAFTAVPCLLAAYYEYKMRPPRNGWATTALVLSLAKPFAYIYLIHLKGQFDFTNENVQVELIQWSLWFILWAIFFVYLVKTWQKPNEI